MTNQQGESRPLSEARQDWARRDAILFVAQERFAKSGYRSVSLREIAKLAGVSLTLVNHHFGAKHALFEQVVNSWQDMVFECMAALGRLSGLPVEAYTDEDVVDALFECIDALDAHPNGKCLRWINFRSPHDEEPHVAAALMRLFMPLGQSFVQALARLHPELTRAQLAWTYLMARGAFVERIAAPAWVPGLAGADGALEEIELGRLLRAYVSGGIHSSIGAAKSP